MISFMQLLSVLPEVIIFLTGVILLIYGAFVQRYSISKINFLASLGLCLAILSLIFFNSDNSIFNNSFLNNAFTKIMKLLVILVAIIAIYISSNYLKNNQLNLFEYPVLFLFSILGMLIMISANDLIMLYVALELQSLSLYVLVALKRESVKASEASLKYFILGSLASAIILYGASMIYSVTGTTNYDLIKNLYVSSDNIIFSFGIILIISGVAFKLSAAPFHMWTPDVYEGSPSSVTTILVTLPKLAALTVLIHLLLKPFLNQIDIWQTIVAMIALLSMAIGSISALKQDNLKRLFAYSTIANIGYVIIGLVCANEVAIEASLLYIFIYTFGALGIFSFIMILRREDTQLINISDLSGFSKANSILSIAVIILLLSMAGIPPFAGFFAKLYIFTAAIESGFLYLAIAGVIFSVVSAFYYLKIIKTIYLDENNDELIINFDKKQSLVIILTALIMLLFVFYGNDLISFINNTYNLN